MTSAETGEFLHPHRYTPTGQHPLVTSFLLPFNPLLLPLPHHLPPLPSPSPSLPGPFLPLPSPLFPITSLHLFSFSLTPWISLIGHDSALSKSFPMNFSVTFQNSFKTASKLSTSFLILKAFQQFSPPTPTALLELINASSYSKNL